MERDFLPDAPQDSPSFFFHLGDVVYYDGEGPNYYAEFYEPYIHYPAPIFAIPGNHDGDVNPATGETSLEAFVRNFCSQTPVFSPDNHDAPRHTMTQPNVYWTLETPLATIIGLYSNCPEGGQVSPAQIQWFETELRTAPADRAMIVAVHHPIYSAYGPHPGSQHLKGMLDQACAAAGRSPDLVLTGHVHNYQRFASPVLGMQGVPFIVAGAGGYNKRLHVLSRAFHGAKLPIQIQGAEETLVQFNDAQHGYLKIAVTAKKILCQYYAVPEPSTPTNKPLQPFDSVEVQLRK
jgi:acid phosphatase type 7